MLDVAYRFRVRTSERTAFRHAWQAAQFTLEHVAGLRAYRLAEPGEPDAGYVVRLVWADRRAFDDFTRTWFGVWLVNGLGLAPSAFATPVSTSLRGAPPRVRPAPRHAGQVPSA